MKKIPVRKLMSGSTAAARPEMPVSELVMMFASEGVRGLPVTDDEGRLVGVVSETDLFLKEKGVPFSMEKAPSLLGEFIDKDEVDQFERCKSVKVEEVMTDSVYTASEDDTLEDVAMLMFERKLTMLPVVEDDRVVGVVRRIDILRKIYHYGG